MRQFPITPSDSTKAWNGSVETVGGAWDAKSASRDRMEKRCRRHRLDAGKWARADTAVRRPSAALDGRAAIGRPWNASPGIRATPPIVSIGKLTFEKQIAVKFRGRIFSNSLSPSAHANSFRTTESPINGCTAKPHRLVAPLNSNSGDHDEDLRPTYPRDPGPAGASRQTPSIGEEGRDCQTQRVDRAIRVECAGPSFSGHLGGVIVFRRVVGIDAFACLVAFGRLGQRGQVQRRSGTRLGWAGSAPRLVA